jgi:uncharacterized protein GlcG (DUF336 family)
MAKEAMAAPDAKSNQNNCNVARSIVNCSGDGVMLQRLYGTQLASPRPNWRQFEIGKSKMARDFDVVSHNFSTCIPPPVHSRVWFAKPHY